jgi:hypothetical protein
MQLGQLFSNVRRWGAVTAPKLSRFGHTATNVLSRVGNIGQMIAQKGGQFIDTLDKTPLGQNPEAAAVFGAGRALLRDVGIGANFASRAAAQGNRVLTQYDQKVLPAAQKYLSSDFERRRG